MFLRKLVLELVVWILEYVGRNSSCSLSSFPAGKAGKAGSGDSGEEDMLVGKDRSTNTFLPMQTRKNLHQAAVHTVDRNLAGSY